MFYKWFLGIGLVIATVTSATAQLPNNSQVQLGQLISQYSCPPSGPCAQCAGPGGAFNVNSNNTIEVYQFTAVPRRVWLQTTTGNHILGADDRCHFLGTPSVPLGNPPPVGSSSLGGPPAPQCICIGNQCNPLGCGPH